jgi:hypothetical protein
MIRRFFVFFGILLCIPLFFITFFAIQYQDGSQIISIPFHEIEHDPIKGTQLQLHTEFEPSNILFQIEIISQEHKVVQSQHFFCEKSCTILIPITNLKKNNNYTAYIVFEKNRQFYNYEYEFTYEVNNEYGDEEDDFELEPLFSERYKEKKLYSFKLPKKTILSKNSQQLEFQGLLTTKQPSEFIFEYYPKSKPELQQEINLYCETICDISLLVEPPIILDTYIFNIYTPLGESQYKSKVKYKKNKGIYNSKNIQQQIITQKKIKTLGKQHVQGLEISLPNTKKNLSVFLPNIQNENSVELGIEEIDPETLEINETVAAFAIDPTPMQTILGNFTLTFRATGTALHKCEQYQFATQSCFGKFKKILDTIPGQTYTITLNPKDPLFIETIAQADNDVRARDGTLQLTSVLRIGRNNQGRIFDSYFRFDNVSVPFGATINSAYINFTSTAGRSGTNVFTNIYGLKEVNCTHFNTGAGGDDPTNNARTTAFTPWDNIPAWANLEQSTNTQTPDLSSIVQEVTSLSGWTQGNALCFVVADDGSDNNAFRDIATVGEGPAQLFVDFTNPPASLLWNTSQITQQVYAGNSISNTAEFTSILTNDNTQITKISGPSFMSVNQTSFGSLLDTQTRQVQFTCNPNSGQSPGNYQAIYNITSTQFTQGSVLTLNCSVFVQPLIQFIDPTTSSPRSVTSGSNQIISFKVFDNTGTEITSDINILQVNVGNQNASYSLYSPLQLTSQFSLLPQVTAGQGIAVYGDTLWISNNADDSIHEYKTDGTYITSYSVAGQTLTPGGVTTIDGTEFWVSDNAGPNPDDVILHYDSNWNFIDSFDVSTQTDLPFGLTYDGTSFYVVDDRNADSILQYTSAGTFLGAIDVSSETTTARGLTIFGDDLWFIDAGGVVPNDVIMHYKTNGSLIGTFDISTETGTPTGIATRDGHQFYVVDNDNDRVLVYEEQTLQYNIDHYQANITMPQGLGDLQNLTLSLFYVSNGNEYQITQTEVNALQFPEINPPGTITNLTASSSTSNQITWTWTNPLDADYSHVEIYLNGSFYANVSTPISQITTTGLLPNTTYTLSTRTVDTLGNINTTWVNATATTNTVPQVTLIEPVSGTGFIQNSNVTLTINASDSNPITLTYAIVTWGTGFENVTLSQIVPGTYSANFTTTNTIDTYNVTFYVTNSLGETNNQTITDFDITSPTPFQDTFIRFDSPNTNYATNSRIVTDSQVQVRRGLLRFDLAYLPQGIRIDDAEMGLYLSDESGGDLFHDIFRITSDWNESTTTWNTQPSFDAATIWASSFITVPAQWYYWNLTTLVQNWYNGTYQNYGIYIFENGEATNGRKRYYSSNSGINVPQLNISYTDIQPPQISSGTTNNSNIEVQQSFNLQATATDNIAVDTVLAQITSPSGIQQNSTLTLQSGFTYTGSFTPNEIGTYKIQYWVNDTTNLQNITPIVNVHSYAHNISLRKQTKHFLTYQIQNYTLINNENPTLSNKEIFVSLFIPNTLTVLSPFQYTTSSNYTIALLNETLSDPRYNGTMYQFILTSTTPSQQVLQPFETWNLVVNTSQSNKTTKASFYLR